MQRFCVFTSAGDRNTVRRWLPPSGDRCFDLLVAFHGQDDTRFAEMRETATRAWRIEAGKFPALHALRQAGEIDLSAYSHVWLPDDDVLVDAADVPSLFALAAAYDFWVCQPGFAAGGRAARPVAMADERRAQVRVTDYVSSACPLFRRDRLDAFLDTYDGTALSIGLDWWVGHALGAAWSGRFAVIDAILALQPRPGAAGPAPGTEPDPRAAWQSLRVARGIRVTPGVTLATLPLPPGHAPSRHSPPGARRAPPAAIPRHMPATPDPSAADAAGPVFGALHMTRPEAEAFRAALARPGQCYLEWGLGGSTRAALLSRFSRIVSVESDAGWIAAARADPGVAEAEASGRATILHGDIGRTGPWGMPQGGDASIWTRYVEAPWPVLAAGGDWPDLVLVDGRFRMACAFALAREAVARPGLAPPRLVLHDHGPERPHYDIVQDAWDTEQRAGTLHVMRLRPGLDPGFLEGLVRRYTADPR